MNFKYIFRPTKFKPFTKDVFGFDIETYDKNKKFYCVSIYGDDYQKTFFNKEDFKKEILNRRFQNSVMVASNLLFDFFGMFYGDKTIKNFMTLFRGSNLLYAKTYLRDNKFNRFPIKSNRNSLLFLDTLNYAKMTVDSLGQLIGIKKLKKPSFLGQKPKNKKEHEEMVIYNMRDAEISQKGLLFLYESFQSLGANPKMTIASTAMSAYRNQYQKENYFPHNPNDLLEIFNSYYGGRTEAFMRGKIEDINYYDINSLYPYVMKKYSYPSPNSLRKNFKNTLDFIYNYEGFSHVSIISPEHAYPFLPYRTPQKLLFPVGKFRGWYTNVELREALKYGYIITKVYRNIYFKETCEPFKDFVTDLYAKRLFLKSNKSPMEYVVKILMNSLYGKFGQRFDNKENWVPIPDEFKGIKDCNILEIKGDYIRMKSDCKPSIYCYPEWSSYVAAYGRIELYNLIRQCHPLYVDTDSVMTTKKLPTGNKLGELKLEMRIDEGVIVKPKLYCIKGSKGAFVKAKGIGTQMDYGNFVKYFLVHPHVEYNKFLKFKEALRRNLLPNQIISMAKDLDLEDNKRNWKEKFNQWELQSSTPREMDIEEPLLQNQCLVSL